MLSIQKSSAQAVALVSLLLFNLGTPLPLVANPTPNPGCPTGTYEQKTEAIRRILQDGDSQGAVYLRSRLLYTGPILQLIESCGQAAIPALNQIIKTETTPQTRTLAITVLSEIGGRDAIKPWLTLLLKWDANPDTRKLVATLLGTMSDIEALDALSSSLFNEREASVRLSVAEALGNIGRLEGVYSLRQMAQTDSDDGVRLAALIGLTRIPNSGASDLFIAALGSEQNPEARRTAARVLGRVSNLQARKNWLGTFYGGKELSERLQNPSAFTTNPIDEARAKAALLKALQSDSDFRTRQEAAEGLGNLEYAGARDGLIAALQADSQPPVRREAAEALGKLRDNDSRAALIVAMRQDTDADVRLAATSALGRIGGSQTRDALLAKLPISKDPAQRVLIASILHNTYGNIPEARDILLTILQSEQEPMLVRLNAITALRRSKDPILLPALIATLNANTHPSVSAAAATSLGQINHPLAVRALSAALQKHPEMNVRMEAAMALGKIKQPQTRTALLEALNSWQYTNALQAISIGRRSSEEYAPVLHAIALGLRDTDRAKAIPVFMALLQYWHEDTIRRNATQVLGEMQATEAIPLLKKILKASRSIYVRSTAADALANIARTGNRASVNDLFFILNANSFTPDTRAFAANALGQAANPVAINPLITIMENADEPLWLRSQAAYALSAIGAPAINPLRQRLASANRQAPYLAMIALAEMNLEIANKVLISEKETVKNILVTVNRQNLAVPYLKIVRSGADRPFLILSACKLGWLSRDWRRCRQSPDPRVSYYPPQS